MLTESSVLNFKKNCDAILSEISKDVVGEEDIIRQTVIAIIAGGNVLLEGVPGLGKTRLVRTLGRVLDMPFSRIQFTPDLMPADVTGTNIVIKDEKGNVSFMFKKGPVFCSLLLADEINRATPKTQSALLEAMQEHTVTVAGESYRLEEPFFVLATQNPIEQEGTYPLPEAQMDRFMFKVLVPFPSDADLKDIVVMTQKKTDAVSEKQIDRTDLLEMRDVAREIPVSETVLDYVAALIGKTHPERDNCSPAAAKYLRFGASPRAAQALVSGAKVLALMSGRYNASVNDIKTLAYPVLRHRIALNFEAVTGGLSPDDVIKLIIEEN